MEVPFQEELAQTRPTNRALIVGSFQTASYLYRLQLTGQGESIDVTSEDYKSLSPQQKVRRQKQFESQKYYMGWYGSYKDPYLNQERSFENLQALSERATWFPPALTRIIEQTPHGPARREKLRQATAIASAWATTKNRGMPATLLGIDDDMRQVLMNNDDWKPLIHSGLMKISGQPSLDPTSKHHPLKVLVSDGGISDKEAQSARMTMGSSHLMNTPEKSEIWYAKNVFSMNNSQIQSKYGIDVEQVQSRHGIMYEETDFKLTELLSSTMSAKGFPADEYQSLFGSVFRDPELVKKALTGDAEQVFNREMRKRIENHRINELENDISIAEGMKRQIPIQMRFELMGLKAFARNNNLMLPDYDQDILTVVGNDRDYRYSGRQRLGGINNDRGSADHRLATDIDEENLSPSQREKLKQKRFMAKYKQQLIEYRENESGPSLAELELQQKINAKKRFELAREIQETGEMQKVGNQRKVVKPPSGRPAGGRHVTPPPPSKKPVQQPQISLSDQLDQLAGQLGEEKEIETQQTTQNSNVQKSRPRSSTTYTGPKF